MSRHDVWTDAGHDEGDYFPIAVWMTFDSAHNLAALLKHHGWKAEVRAADRELSRMRRSHQDDSGETWVVPYPRPDLSGVMEDS